MPTISRRFGDRVKESIHKAGLSHRGVVQKAAGDISHTTVQDMKNGNIPAAEKIVFFALATDDDPNELLRAANKPWLKFDAAEWEKWRGDNPPSETGGVVWSGA